MIFDQQNTEEEEPPSRKKTSIAFLYNVRHRQLDSSNPESIREADLDDPETITAMIAHFKKCGYKVLAIEADKEVYLKLYKYKNRINLVFNYATGIYGQNRTAQIPAMLEMLQIPYTGSSPFTQALVLNKARTKEILTANNIPTLPFQVFKTGQEKLKKNLKFPLIVKPVAQGQSAGVTNKNIVENKSQLKKKVNYLINIFKEPALVEPFLTGREFSVALLGNPPEVLPIIELNHGQLPKNYWPFASWEVKFCLEEKLVSNYITCPAEINKKMENKLKKLALKCWQVLDIFDWCRIDIRCDLAGNPYVLEINSPAALEPPDVLAQGYCSYPLAAKTAGLDYDDLLKKIINSSLKRYSLYHR